MNCHMYDSQNSLAGHLKEESSAYGHLDKTLFVGTLIHKICIGTL